MRFLNLQAICLIFIFLTCAAVGGFQQVNRGSVNQVTYVTAAAGTTSLFATGNQAVFVEGATTQTVKFPSAISLPLDWWYEIVNNSSGTVTVNDNASGLVATISAGRIGKFYLKAKATAAGTWKANVNASNTDLSNFFLKTEFISTSAGASDAGKPIKTNGSGLLDASFLASLSSGITQLTGDITAGPGSGSQAATLATVNGNVGSFTYGSFTVNGKGLITAASSGTAPVTSLTVATANGMAGSFSASVTPVLTLTTSVNGSVCGNGTAFSACTATGSGSTVLATAPTITTPTIAKLANLTANGYVKTSAGDGTLSVQTVAIPATDGGTGQITIAAAFDSFYKSVATTLGDLIYGGASGAPTRLAGDTSNTRKFLREQSSSGVAAAPTWDTIATGDVAFPTTSALAATTAVTIDWNILVTNGGVYTKTLAANTTFTFANPTAGQTIIVRLTNTASNFTGTFSDARLKWPASTAPTITVGAKSDVITFVYDGTSIFGSFVQNF